VRLKAADGAVLVSLETGLLFLGGRGLLDDSGHGAAAGDLEVLGSPF
jgi:hypothetical protein